MKARIAFLLFAALGFIITVAPAFAQSAEAATPRTCAGISNVTNTAWWRVNGGPLQTARYSDMGGPRLIFTKPVPRAVRLAEAKFIEYDAEGQQIIGPKVRHACA